VARASIHLSRATGNLVVTGSRVPWVCCSERELVALRVSRLEPDKVRNAAPQYLAHHCVLPCLQMDVSEGANAAAVHARLRVDILQRKDDAQGLARDDLQHFVIHGLVGVVVVPSKKARVVGIALPSQLHRLSRQLQERHTYSVRKGGEMGEGGRTMNGERVDAVATGDFEQPVAQPVAPVFASLVSPRLPSTPFSPA